MNILNNVIPASQAIADIIEKNNSYSGLMLADNTPDVRRLRYAKNQISIPEITDKIVLTNTCNIFLFSA